MRNIKNPNYGVKYPAKEKASAFMPEDSLPFRHAIVGVTYPISDYYIEREGSPVNGFEYVIEGEGEVLIDGEWKKVSAGDMFILCEYELHRYRSVPSAPWHKLWINYSAEYIKPFMDAYGVKAGIYRIPDIRTHFDRAMELAHDADAYADICYRLAECVHTIITAVSVKANRDADTDCHRIREALGAAVYKKTDLGSIAAELHMSKSNMIRIFKKHYGITPYDHLLGLKIEAAKLLLRSTGMSVKQVADKLGVSDEHYFSTLFLKRVGMRPRDFRRDDSRL